MTWVSQNVSLVAQLTLNHLLISLIPIVLGTFAGAALARVLPGKSAAVAAVLLSAVFAIPSLALFVLLPTLLGTPLLGPTNVIIALTIYAVSTVYFAARATFSSLDTATLRISQAQGFSAWQRFVHVELPLASPGLLAAMRVVAASTISLASIGAVVGVKNLGYLFLDGFQRRIPEEIVTGIVITALLALLFDISIALISRRISPWQRSTQNEMRLGHV